MNGDTLDPLALDTKQEDGRVMGGLPYSLMVPSESVRMYGLLLYPDIYILDLASMHIRVNLPITQAKLIT